MKFPLYKRIENPIEVDKDLSASSGFSLDMAILCRTLMQLGIHKSFEGPEPQRRRFTFNMIPELDMLRDCLAQEVRGKEDWHRIARMLRATNWIHCQEKGNQIRESEDVNRPTVDELLLGYNPDGSPATIDWSLSLVPEISELNKIVEEFSQIPIHKRIQNTHDFDMKLAEDTDLTVNVVKMCRLILHLGIHESLSGPETKKRKPELKLEVERKNLQEKEGCEDWERIARIMGFKDFMIPQVAWADMKAKEAAALYYGTSGTF